MALTAQLLTCLPFKAEACILTRIKTHSLDLFQPIPGLEDAFPRFDGFDGAAAHMFAIPVEQYEENYYYAGQDKPCAYTRIVCTVSEQIMSTALAPFQYRAYYVVHSSAISMRSDKPNKTTSKKNRLGSFAEQRTYCAQQRELFAQQQS